MNGRLVVLPLAFALATAACRTAPPASQEPVASSAPASSVASPTTGSATPASENHFGQPIEANAQVVALADIAKNPDAYAGKTFTTTGIVTAVCQHRGCWMEIKDEASEAHIKMAGHAFFVPRSASGKKARIQATLVKGEAQDSCGDHAGHEGAGKGCKAEAEAQMGRPLAKLELIAAGVELQ